MMNSWTITELRRSVHERRRLLASFAVLILGTMGVVLLPGEDPKSDVPQLEIVGDIKTNGEHWVIFRFDAPKRRGAVIKGAQVIGADNLVVNKLFGDDVRTPPIPGSTMPVLDFVQAGCSKRFEVRESVEGEWRFRLPVVLSLGFPRQQLNRLEACSRLRSFKPWTRNYVERNLMIIESVAIPSTGFFRARSPVDSHLPPHPSPLPWAFGGEGVLGDALFEMPKRGHAEPNIIPPD
jgi:hypothetical protein